MVFFFSSQKDVKRFRRRKMSENAIKSISNSFQVQVQIPNKYCQRGCLKTKLKCTKMDQVQNIAKIVKNCIFKVEAVTASFKSRTSMKEVKFQQFCLGWSGHDLRRTNPMTEKPSLLFAKLQKVILFVSLLLTFSL